MFNREHSANGQGNCKIFNVSEQAMCLGTSFPLPLYPCLLPPLVVCAMGSLASFGHGFVTCDHGGASPVTSMDANRINVNLGFFEGEEGRLVITMIISQYG